MPKKNSLFYNKLVTWYLQNRRSLPWRETKDPYRIWLSEIILQQTRVAQGMPYYENFIETYPTVYELASAPEEEVLKLWQGLGYYSRARNLHSTAQFVVNELDGIFPDTYKDLLKLKGIGDYTASAIASICFNAPTAVVDGNVYRVLSRVFGVNTPINTTQGIKEFKALAQSLLDEKQPGTYNQAIMEFGARHCVPQNPVCSSCIFNDSCEAFRTKKVAELPVKLKKLKVKKRFFNYCVLLSEDNRTVLQKREGKGIWQHLYEFPLIESATALTEVAFHKEVASLEIFKNFTPSTITKYNDTPIIHKLSHQHLVTTFWVFQTAKLPVDGVSLIEVHQYPVPILIGKFMDEFSPFKVS